MRYDLICLDWLEIFYRPRIITLISGRADRTFDTEAMNFVSSILLWSNQAQENLV